MSVKLEKESIHLCEAKCLPYCQATVEGDVIVPDVKPDIQKILEVASHVVINQKNIQTDKIHIQGTVNLNILYLPEQNEEWSVKAIQASQEFNHSIDVKGAKPGMNLCVDVETLPAEFMLLNSRKLSVRSKVGFLARLSGIKEMEIGTGLESDEEVEIKRSSIQIYNPKVDAMREIIVRERLEVPSGNPAICEVLKVSAKTCSSELSLMENYALVKGELKICTLYCPEGEKCAPEAMEHSVMFQERLEIEGLSENMHGEVEYRIKCISYEVCEDSDGDRRILSCEVLIEAAARGFETVECHALEDAYGKNRPVEIEKTAYRIERMLGSETAQATVNERVVVPEYLPDIHKLCEYSSVPTIEKVEVCECQVTVSGYITVNFLYLSKDCKQPISGFSHILPFSHSFDAQGITSDAVCDAKAEVEHIGCTISDDKALQVRAIILTSIKLVAPCIVELVSGINYLEDEGLKRQPSMAVYFVKKGDTLWDVAKKYRTSMDAIVSLNGDEAEIMVPGKCIYIFK